MAAKPKKPLNGSFHRIPNNRGIIEKELNPIHLMPLGMAPWDGFHLCIAGALRAGEENGYRDWGYREFADTCRIIADQGYLNIPKVLFNGEYFIHIPPDYQYINTNKGCHIDQILGQSWVSQLGLPRVLPKAETVSALNAIWKNNFTTNAGGYAINHNVIKGHRIYAEENEAGLDHDYLASWRRFPSRSLE